MPILNRHSNYLGGRGVNHREKPPSVFVLSRELHEEEKIELSMAASESSIAGHLEENNPETYLEVSVP